LHVQGQNQDQATLLPERLDDLIGDGNAVRLIDAFVDSLDLKAPGFARIETKGTGRPPYHPGDLLKLKLYLYGYMYRIRSCRRLERECHKNTEVLWLWLGLDRCLRCTVAVIAPGRICGEVRRQENRYMGNAWVTTGRLDGSSSSCWRKIQRP
jgi:hypothetical protein